MNKSEVYRVNRHLVMIPGPTPTVPLIEREMGRAVTAHGDPQFVADYKETIESAGKLLDCSGQTFIIAGSGTLAMEMAIGNNLKAGDDLLVVSHGYFGDRFVDIAERKGINVDVISSKWGTIVPLEELEKKLKSKKYAAVTVTHVDTSTAVLAPIAEIGQLIDDISPETVYMVDGVAATAGAEAYVDKMHIDVLFTAAQKAFGVCPGLTILFASEKSLNRRKQLGKIADYYADYENWIPTMENPAKYYSTPSVNLIWALKKSIEIIKDEGIEKRYARHEKQGAAMRKALEAMGFKISAEEGHQAPTLTNCLYMDGIDDAEFRKTALEEGIILAGAMGEYAGKGFRVGHMGNADIHDLVSTLAAIERTLVRCNVDIERGKAVGVFEEEMEK